ncbi:hypothetical protein RHAL1_00546 [Beijerinckiaceae bacterium RH AL1]|nr:hypothetical protein RHAL8_00518 [Beijerinckiaceae bacterium RH AL8]VVB43106.1 hypothetical protein RHCH11_RHCH11_00520 [Beijerinckiaceae bacterium RH CH11]VVC53664.1 hypothetical protein RHAL1_00546 [Beijerinckiaceae bacterium RH AL1]
MNWRLPTKDEAPMPARRTREDALAWARQIVAKGVRVVRLRSINARRRDRHAVLPPPKIEIG